MATIHPDIDYILLNSTGAYRERDILEQLQTDLPVGFDVFHSVGFSSTHADKQYYGEIDVLVLSPAGHLATVPGSMFCNSRLLMLAAVGLV